MTEQVVSELESKLIEIIEATQEGVGQAILFGKEQIPDILTQLLWWHGIHNFIKFTICISLFILAYKFLKTHKERVSKFVLEKNGYYEESDEDFMYWMGMMIVGTVMVAMFFITLIGCLDWLKILIAPKLYLLEYSMELLK